MTLYDTTVKNAKPKEKPYKLSDSQGLYILVNPNGSKLWRLKYRIHGKEKKLALGAYPIISISAARKARDRAQEQLRNDVDPNGAKRQAKIDAQIAASNTFEKAAEEFIEFKIKEGKAPATIEKLRWFVTLFDNNFRNSPISKITMQEVFEQLKRHQDRGRHETTNLLRTFVSNVFRRAALTGKCTSDPAEMLKGAFITPKVTHFAAIVDKKEFGALLRAIDDFVGDTSVMYALRITPHIFQRPGEIRQMEWSEVDLSEAIWTLPAEKMKMRQPHLVTLSKQSIEILEAAKKISGRGKYVFPSIRTSQRPISDNTINAALRRIGYSKDQMTAHGFRTSASSLLNESGKWNPDAIERALAHEVDGKIRKIYNRSAYWEERVAMAQWWSDYIDQLRNEGQAHGTPTKI